MSERIRCELVPAETSQRVEPCISLERAMQGRSSVRLHQLYHVPTMKQSDSFVALHTGAYGRKGVVLNFCPFCGAEIGSHMKGGTDAE